MTITSKIIFELKNKKEKNFRPHRLSIFSYLLTVYSFENIKTIFSTGYILFWLKKSTDLKYSV